MTRAGIVSADRHICGPAHCSSFDHVDLRCDDHAPATWRVDDGREASIVPGMERPATLGVLRPRQDRAARAGRPDHFDAAPSASSAPAPRSVELRWHHDPTGCATTRGAERDARARARAMGDRARQKIAVLGGGIAGSDRGAGAHRHAGAARTLRGHTAPAGLAVWRQVRDRSAARRPGRAWRSMASTSGSAATTTRSHCSAAATTSSTARATIRSRPWIGHGRRCRASCTTTGTTVAGRPSTALRPGTGPAVGCRRGAAVLGSPRWRDRDRRQPPGTAPDARRWTTASRPHRTEPRHRPPSRRCHRGRAGANRRHRRRVAPSP